MDTINKSLLLHQPKKNSRDADIDFKEVRDITINYEKNLLLQIMLARIFIYLAWSSGPLEADFVVLDQLDVR